MSFISCTSARRTTISVWRDLPSTWRSSWWWSGWLRMMRALNGFVLFWRRTAAQAFRRQGASVAELPGFPKAFEAGCALGEGGPPEQAHNGLRCHGVRLCACWSHIVAHGSHCQVQAFEAKVIKAPGWQYSDLMPKGGHAWNKRRPAQEVKNVIMRTSCVCVCLASLLAGLKFACKHGRGHDRHVLIIQWLLLSAKVQLVVKASLTWRYIRYTYRRLFWKTESWSLVHPCPCLAVNMEAWNTLLVV